MLKCRHRASHYKKKNKWPELENNQKNQRDARLSPILLFITKWEQKITDQQKTLSQTRQALLQLSAQPQGRNEERLHAGQKLCWSQTTLPVGPWSTQGSSNSHGMSSCLWGSFVSHQLKNKHEIRWMYIQWTETIQRCRLFSCFPSLLNKRVNQQWRSSKFPSHLDNLGHPSMDSHCCLQE